MEIMKAGLAQTSRISPAQEPLLKKWYPARKPLHRRLHISFSHFFIIAVLSILDV
jgi:hypothetical protein